MTDRVLERKRERKERRKETRVRMQGKEGGEGLLKGVSPQKEQETEGSRSFLKKIKLKSRIFFV